MISSSEQLLENLSSKAGEGEDVLEMPEWYAVQKHN